jgi:hypothetical protein
MNGNGKGYNLSALSEHLNRTFGTGAKFYLGRDELRREDVLKGLKCCLRDNKAPDFNLRSLEKDHSIPIWYKKTKELHYVTVKKGQ